MAQDHSVFSNIQDNRTSSLAEQVADQINQVIIDQNINAGEKLPNEFELAARLNVGRGTIREAVKLLVARNCLGYSQAASPAPPHHQTETLPQDNHVLT